MYKYIIYMYKYCFRNVMGRQTRRHYLTSEELASIIALYKTGVLGEKTATQNECSKILYQNG